MADSCSQFCFAIMERWDFRHILLFWPLWHLLWIRDEPWARIWKGRPLTAEVQFTHQTKEQNDMLLSARWSWWNWLITNKLRYKEESDESYFTSPYASIDLWKKGFEASLVCNWTSHVLHNDRQLETRWNQTSCTVIVGGSSRFESALFHAVLSEEVP